MAAEAFDLLHPVWSDVLSNHVTNGFVVYADLKRHPEALESYLSSLSGVSEEGFKAWTRNDQLAFFINAYNATTVKLIVDHYPVSGIRKIGGLIQGPWKQEVVRLWGRRMSLDDLEHQVIRPKYPDFRVHFALVCAARGCPPLRNEAYTGARLNDQLEDQARRFLANSAKNRIDAQERTVYLSPIFQWYRKDFETSGGSVFPAIQPYWPKTVVVPSDLPKFRIRYTDYDWSLNSVSDHE